MADDTPRYVIFVDHDEESVMYTAPIDDGDADYFVNHIIRTLRPISAEEYMNGPAILLHTFAKSSYVLFKNAVYWLIEWEPGLIVIRFSPDAEMSLTALRSPVPNFGGRAPMEEDLRDYDDEAENSQYNLIFSPWDSQFEEDTREYHRFTRADPNTIAVYQAAFEHVNTIGAELQTRYSDEADFKHWMNRCKLNLSQWAGEGIRVPR